MDKNDITGGAGSELCPEWRMNQKGKLTIPNLITSTRIVGAVGLLFVKPLSVAFFVIYTICGISDAIDGWVARVTNSTSEFGAKLDSVSDILFYSVMAIHIFPILLRELPIVLWCVAAVVILIRAISYLLVAVKYHRFAAQHTYMNKVTSIVIFTMPYLLVNLGATVMCTVLGVVSGIASVEELLIHIFSKNYDSKVKTILHLQKKVA